jgi:UDP-glucuronate decarboxylase
VLRDHRQHERRRRVVRIFNTYGPRMLFDDGRVVSNFLVQAHLGQRITVYGDGEQSRSFCFVDDLVDGIVRRARWRPRVRDAAQPRQPSSSAPCSSSPSAVMKPSPGATVELVRRPAPRRTTRGAAAPTSLKREASVIGFEPKVELLEGLAKTHENFRERMG